MADNFTSRKFENQNSEVVDWSDLGAKMWSFLTGRNAAINYDFDKITVEVPRDTGPNAPRAIWKLDGTITVTTSDDGDPVAPSRISE